MPEGFKLTIFVNICIVCCFGIVCDIVHCVCCPGKKHYSLLGCPLFGFDIGNENREYELSFDDFFFSQTFIGRSTPKSKVTGGLPASYKECRCSVKLFLILSLIILFMEKFIFHSMAKGRR